MEDGTERRPEIRCRDCAGRGRVRRWPDILDSNAEMIRCPMCFGTGTIPETEAASRSRDAEIRRHEGRRAAERVRNATEGQAAVSDLERWLSAEAEAKRKAEAETERGTNRVPATREAEPRSVVAQRGAGASSREAARTTREAEANEQSPSPPPPPFPPRKQPPARSPRPRRRRRRSRAFRTVMALIVMFAILGGIGYLAIEDADEMLRAQASNVSSAVSALLESQATPVAEPAPALATSEPAPPPHLVAATLPPPPTASPTPPILSTPLPAILQPIPTDPRPPAVTAETVASHQVIHARTANQHTAAHAGDSAYDGSSRAHAGDTAHATHATHATHAARACAGDTAHVAPARASVSAVWSGTTSPVCGRSPVGCRRHGAMDNRVHEP